MIVYKYIRFALAICLIIAAGAPASGCTGYGSDAGKSCELDFYPFEDGGPRATGALVLGQVRVRCEAAHPPQRHALVVTLERRDGGRWVAQGEPARSAEIPGSRWSVVQVRAACRPGYWRISVVADGSIEGLPFHYERASRVRSIAINECG